MSTTDQPTVLERVARAVHSDDLSHRETLCDVDYIHGLGVVGQHQRHGTALLDLHMTLDKDAVRDAMRVALQVVREVARRRGWTMTALKGRKVATEALALYLNPTCSCCQGRGKVGVERNPIEAVVTCSHCKGSGRKVSAGYRLRTEPCAHCHGKGTLRKLSVAPAYHPKPCLTCGGTGKKPMPLKNRREIAEVLYVMEERLRSAMDGVRRVMRTAAPRR